MFLDVSNKLTNCFCFKGEVIVHALVGILLVILCIVFSSKFLSLVNFHFIDMISF